MYMNDSWIKRRDFGAAPETKEDFYPRVSLFTPFTFQEMPSIEPRTKSNKATNKSSRTLPRQTQPKKDSRTTACRLRRRRPGPLRPIPVHRRGEREPFLPTQCRFREYRRLLLFMVTRLIHKDKRGCWKSHSKKITSVGVDGFRRQLHNDIPRERYWNGRWRPRWNKDQRCYDEFVKRRTKVRRRTRVLIEQLEELGETFGERS